MNRLELALDSYCIDDDLQTILKNYDFESNVDLDDIDYDWELHSSDLTFSHSFQVNDKKENIIYDVTIYGEAQKEISYDRWVGSHCIVINDYEYSLSLIKK